LEEVIVDYFIVILLNAFAEVEGSCKPPIPSFFRTAEISDTSRRSDTERYNRGEDICKQPREFIYGLFKDGLNIS
jgi:hypothetical protein